MSVDTVPPGAQELAFEESLQCGWLEANGTKAGEDVRVANKDHKGDLVGAPTVSFTNLLPFLPSLTLFSLLQPWRSQMQPSKWGRRGREQSGRNDEDVDYIGIGSIILG